jgi:hypothetical protein
MTEILQKIRTRALEFDAASEVMGWTPDEIKGYRKALDWVYALLLTEAEK